jgi:hypothetical protein
VKQVRRSERAQFLERLCELRRIYALRGQDDRTSGMSIDEAVLMMAASLEAEAPQALSSHQPA